MSADRADAHRPAGAPAVAEDALLGGRGRLVQPAEGYRAAIDPVFLAAAVPAAAGEAVLDAGAGAGAAVVGAVYRDKEPSATLLVKPNWSKKL